MASAFQIRQATARDCDGILRCLRAAFEPYRCQYTPAAFADTVLDHSTLEIRMREMRVLVAVSGDEVVGTIGCVAASEEGHLRGMAVLSGWQGSGVASALLRAAEDDLRKNGCAFVTLDTTEPLQRAIRFYEKHGYVRSGRVRDFFGMGLYEYTKGLGSA